MSQNYQFETLAELKELLDEGIDPNLIYNGRIPALYTSIQYNQLNLVRSLLSLGANPDIQAPNGATALMIASGNGNTTFVKMLLDAGANPNLQQMEGTTALMFASKNGHSQVVELLLNAGANPNLLNQRDQNAFVSAELLQNRKIAERLFAISQPITQVSYDKWQMTWINSLSTALRNLAKTLLALAVNQESYSVIRTYLETLRELNERLKSTLSWSEYLELYNQYRDILNNVNLIQTQALQSGSGFQFGFLQ